MTKEELLQLRQIVLNLNKPSKIVEFLPKMNCYDFLYECNKDRLNSRAINYLGNVITYKELFDMIDEAAKSFVAMGIKKGDYVTVSLLSTPEAIITFYSLNKIGAVSHMLNPASSETEITEFINNVKSKVYVTMDLFYSERIKNAIDKTNVDRVVITSLLDSFNKLVNIDKIKYKLITDTKRIKNPIKDDKCIMWRDFNKCGLNNTIQVESIYEENINASIAYTSGSTGVSKAVVATNEAMNAMPIQMGMTDQTFAPNDVIFNSLPIWIYYSLVNNIHDPLCLGVTLALDPLFDSKKIHTRLKQYRFNHWNTIPAYVDDMCNDKYVKKLNLSYLKSITTGGDFLTNNVKKKADELLESCHSNIKVGQGYGASEVLGSFSYTYEKDATIGSVGKPLIGNKVKIIDLETNQELGMNQIGELYLYSPTMMREYYGNIEATNEVLIKDNEGIIWYKTGDLAHISANGELYIDGRIRRIVLTKDSKGFPTKIIPDKIKKEILLNNFVHKCEIITVPDNDTINKSIAFIVLNDEVEDIDNIKNELIDYCEKKLPQYMVPSDIKFIDRIPLNKSSKPDLKKLEEIYYDESNQKVKKNLK